MRRPPAAYHTLTTLAPRRPPLAACACSHRRALLWPTRPRCYRWVLTDCAAHPEARCVIRPGLHRVGIRRATWHSPPWSNGSGVPQPRRTPVFDEPREAVSEALSAHALTRDGAPAVRVYMILPTPSTLLVYRSCNARSPAASSTKTRRCSTRTRAACSKKLDTTSWEGRPEEILTAQGSQKEHPSHPEAGCEL